MDSECICRRVELITSPLGKMVDVYLKRSSDITHHIYISIPYLVAASNLENWPSYIPRYIATLFQ